MENYMTQKEAARYLGTSPATIRRLMESGRLPKRFVGFMPKFRKDELDKVVQQKPYYPADPEGGEQHDGA